MKSDNKPDNKEKAPLTNREKTSFRLALMRRTFSYIGIGLVCSALVGGLYGDRLHFVWALCAAGAILFAMGWFEYLRATDSLPRLFRKKRQKPKTPYVWRKEKQSKHHKPSFMQNAEDFEDDLTPYTTADEEIFSAKLRSRAIIISRMTAGALLFLASFIIPQ